MDKDVESRLNRLCERYLNAEARIALQRPVRLPSGRSQRRAENSVVDTLTELIEARKSPAAALVRLAYVRAMRAVNKNARLGEDQRKEVDYLVKRLDNDLCALEGRALLGYRRHIRHLRTAQSMRRIGASESISSLVESSEKPWPLEQRARASVLSIIRWAEMAGTLAATQSDSYDGQPNAD